LVLNAGVAGAQTYGFATMQPGTLNHTSASAVAKVLKEKAGANVVVQPTAGESVLIPLISRGEAEFGIANIFEVEQAKQSSPNIRLIGSLHPLRGAFWVRKDTNMKTIADLKGKKVGMGYSAMRTIDPLVRAILATGGLTQKDGVPGLIPKVIRGPDDLEQRLVNSVRATVHSDGNRVGDLYARLVRHSPDHLAREYRVRHEGLDSRLRQAWREYYASKEQRLSAH